MHTKTWTVQIFLSEENSLTRARALLFTDDNAGRLEAEGTAHTHPGEPNVPEIGDEIATSRALSGLGHKLFDSALEDIRWVLQKV
jgi:hypothetical protein